MGMNTEGLTMKFDINKPFARRDGKEVLWWHEGADWNDSQIIVYGYVGEDSNTCICLVDTLGKEFSGGGLRPKGDLLNKPKGRLPTRELPLPETIAPRTGVSYYTPDPWQEGWYYSFDWSDDEWDFKCLERGQVYLSKEDAVEVAKACVVERVE